MFKVSASQLSTVKAYRDNEITLDDVVKRFTTPYSNQRMDIGTSFHSIIEAGPKFLMWAGINVMSPSYAGYTFDRYQLMNFIDWLELDGTEVHEYKERYKIDLGHRQWLLTTKCDILLLDRVIDLKTTYSSYDWETYYESPQWKAYCLAFNVPQFEYRVAQIKLNPGTKKADIVSKHLLSLTRSNYSDEEVIELVELTDYIERNTELSFKATEAEWQERQLVEYSMS